jgi:8-oxo-dGTP diphosphatase
MPLAVATIIFSEDKKKVLLIKRRDVPVFALPGGGVEAYEFPENAAIRETLEETNLHCKIEKVVGYYYPVSKIAHPTIVYLCQKISGQESVSDETLAIDYFDLDQLPKLLPPFYKEWIFDALKNNPAVFKPLLDVSYKKLFSYLISHPILVFRYLLAKLKLPYNTKLQRRK